MAVGDVFRLAVESSFTGVDQIVNVFHFMQQGEAEPSSNPAELLATDWHTGPFVEYRLCLPSRCTFRVINVAQVVGGGAMWETTVTDNGGLGTGDMTPLTAAPLISWRSGQAGRRKRGRSYMPPILESLQDAGLMGSEMIGFLEDFASANIEFDSSLGEAYWRQVVYSPEDLDADPPREGTLVTPVLTFIVRDVLATQRRRRQGTGS